MTLQTALDRIVATEHRHRGVHETALEVVQGEGIVCPRLNSGEDRGEGEALAAKPGRALAPLPPNVAVFVSRDQTSIAQLAARTPAAAPHGSRCGACLARISHGTDWRRELGEQDRGAARRH